MNRLEKSRNPLVWLVASACMCLLASGLRAAEPGPLPGVKMQVINFPSDPPGELRRAPGGGRILTPAVLFTPAAGDNVYAPAIVMLDEGPGSHPLEPDQASRFAAERLAAMGYTVLSVYAGQERGFARAPFAQTALAVRGALDYLEIAGHENFVLVGHSYGALVAAQYLASERDTLMDNGGEKRVKATVLINPLTELRNFPRADLQQRYDERVAQAEASVAAGRGGIPELEPGRAVGQAYDPWLLAGPFIAPALNWLDYWGPQAARRNAELLQSLAVPTLVLVAGHDPTVSLQKLSVLKTASTLELHPYPLADSHFSGQHDAVSHDIARWLAAQQLGVTPRVRVQVLDAVASDGRDLQGVLYTPEQGLDKTRPALVLIGGRTADTIQSSTHWMGVRMAAKGMAVFAPGLRVSGVAGFMASTHAEAAADIGVWIDRAAALGYPRIVLTGHSNGGIWISNYMSLRQDPRVVGMVYFAPTRDTVAEAQKAEGAQYTRNIEIARDAVARGDGLRVVIGLMSAQSWWDNNGPASRGEHTRRVTEFDRPALAIAGGRDPLMAPDFLAEFQNKYRGRLTLRVYPDGSHGLRENKPRLGDDVAAWLAKTFPRTGPKGRGVR